MTSTFVLPLRRQNLPAFPPVAGSVLLLFFLLICPAANAEPNKSIFGVWATPKYHGHVLVEPCGEAVCAQVLDGDPLRANPAQTDVYNHDPAKRSRRVKGLHILKGYRGGPQHWTGGTLYDPQTGDESSDTTLDLAGNGTLEVRGCRLFFCRSEIWRRDKAGLGHAPQ